MNLVIAAVSTWLVAIALCSQEYWLLWLPILGLTAATILVDNRTRLGSLWLITLPSALLVLASYLLGPVERALPDCFAWLRLSFRTLITGIDSDSASLVLGLAVGDDSLVRHELKDAMQLTSLTHLMAVSGANCAIMVAAIYFLLFRLQTMWRVVISILTLTVYVLLVGGSPSVLRAALMASVVLIAMALGRKSNPLAALSLSVIVLLIFDPSLSVSYSFCLSVLATAGILIAAPLIYLRTQGRLGKKLALAISISAGAQLFCFPVLLGLQGGLPTYSLAANLLAEPLIAPITILGIVAICFFWLPGLASAITWLASVFAWPVAQLAFFFSNLPLATMPWSIDGWGVVAATVLVVAVLLLLTSKSPVLKNLSAITSVIIFFCSVGALLNQAVQQGIWPQSNWQIVSCDVGQGDATVIRSGSSIAVVDVGRDEKKIDTCLSKLGVTQIELLVLTHYDADHVAGLAGALKSRIVTSAMLTSFQDDRPGANFSRFELENKGVPIITAETGLTGKLHEVIWEVLSPSRSAQEAVDPNDGSITMSWHFADFQLITMADLGEPGQQRIASNYEQWHLSEPTVLKVSHHGSADQYPELLEQLGPEISLISVGKNNGYGHPTKRTLNTLSRVGSKILRTDLLGSIAVARTGGKFEVSFGGSS